MLASLRQAGMSPPRFEDRISTFQVTFPNHSLLDADTLRWLERRGGAELTDSQRMGLALMRRGEALTNSVYRQVTGLDSRVVTRELGDLVNRGFVEQAGSRRWATYRLAPDPAEEEAMARDARGRRDRRRDVLNLLQERGELSRAEIAHSLGLTDGTVKSWLAILRAEGKVEFTTASLRAPNVRYRLSGASR